MPARPARRAIFAAASLALLGTLAFGVLAPPERCPRVDTGDLRRAAGETVGWFVRNQRADGTWLYLWNLSTHKSGTEDGEEYNIVRHAGAISGLYQAATAGIPGALGAADKGLGWALDRLESHDGASALAGEAPWRTGSTALLASGLVERRILTGDGRYDDTLRRFGKFLTLQTEPTGAVLAYFDPGTGRPVPRDYSEFFTGEAYWALARIHRLFPDEPWGKVSDRIGTYLATRRDDAEDYWPPLPDHWAAYGLAETAKFPERHAARPLTEAEVAFARRQAGIFGSQVRWVSQRKGPWGRLVRGSFVPRGGGYGVIGEGLTGLWRASRADPRLADLRPVVAERALCNASLAIRAQSAGPDPAERGAWFRDGETRMDDQQHALSALLRTVAIAEADEPPGPGEPPRAWLWLAALVACWNPPRAALAVPRLGRTRREVMTVAAVGGLVAGTAVVILAALSGPLRDALDVSRPALRIAVGVIAAATGVVDLVRRAPAGEPALGGWRAALVPVAVPVVARPALLLMAISAGADQGAGVAAGAAAVAAGALMALAVAPPEGVSRTASSWAGALLGACLVAAGAALVVNGVLDV